jgi:hypothetical protein
MPVGRMPARRPPVPRHAAVPSFAGLEVAKWTALVTMAIDHYGKIVEPDLYVETHAIGRLSFPLFAMIVGARLALRPQLAGRYARRLLPWALVSQPIYVMVGRPWGTGNILFTLLLGVGATVLVERLQENRLSGNVATAALLLSPLAFLVEYGPIGIAIVPATALLVRHWGDAALWATGPFGLAANLDPTIPPLEAVDFFALGSSVVARGSVAASVSLPRLPTHAFYAFYPGHLLALHLWDLCG